MVLESRLIQAEIKDISYFEKVDYDFSKFVSLKNFH